MYIKPRELLNILIQNGEIDKNAANRIEIESLNKNQAIDEYLLNNNLAKKTEVLKAVASILKVQYVDLTSIAIDPLATGLIPESVAKTYNVIPTEYNPQEKSINLAMNDPLNLSLIDFLEKKTGKKIIPFYSDKENIVKILSSAYSQGLSPEVNEALIETNKEASHRQKEEIAPTIKEAPIAKIINTILEFAIKSRASDVHIEPMESKSRVRYRIDGILNEKLSLPKTIHEALVSRVKIMSEMKIDEKRIPQDGRFTMKLGTILVDFRVSTLPITAGEKIVMRLLRKSGGLPSLNDLGLRGPQLKDLEDAILKPYGIILVTGPTGSGKTTTLYSMLTRLNKPGVNILTLEDPVEYQIQGINQVQINPQAGLTFATGLRAFLRQDPNIILVGEIRDHETTQLAIQAALTGHLVFSTLHTNDASTAIPRLIDLGAEPFLISSVLNASLAQRIVRKVCDYCKKNYNPIPDITANIKEVLGDLLPKKFKDGQEITLTKGEGCDQCNGTGYFGRLGIFEVLKISSQINKMIVKHATAKEIVDQAKSEGLILMKQDGYLKALEGVTTLEEVLRVAEI